MYQVIVEDVLRVPTDETRKHALRKCVVDNEDLLRDFDDRFDYEEVSKLPDHQIVSLIHEFIDMINLRIVSEVPTVRVTHTNRYVVDMLYNIDKVSRE